MTEEEKIEEILNVLLGALAGVMGEVKDSLADDMRIDPWEGWSIAGVAARHFPGVIGVAKEVNLSTASKFMELARTKKLDFV